MKHRSAVVLAYHSIATDDGASAIGPFCVTMRRLRAQLCVMHWMRCVFMDATSFEEAMLSGIFPKHAMFLTFDDGYRNFVSDAVPLLSSFDAPAALFVVTKYVGSTNTWDIEKGMAPLPLACWNELHGATLRFQALTIGSHSASHRPARELSMEELRREIGSSTDTISREGFPRPTLYAYPYGNVTHDAVEVAAQSGFHMAFATHSDVVCSTTDRYRIPRLVVRGNMGAVGLALRILWLRGRNASPLLRKAAHVLAAVRGRLRGVAAKIPGPTTMGELNSSEASSRSAGATDDGSRTGPAGVTASVIIPSFNGARRLPRLMAALSQQDTLHSWEAIVVLDGSDDDSERVLEAVTGVPLRVVVLPENQGTASALNAGFASAVGDVLIRCDDDLVPGPDFVRLHIEQHEDQQHVGIIGLCRNILPDTPYAVVYGREADRRVTALQFGTRSRTVALLGCELLRCSRRFRGRGLLQHRFPRLWLGRHRMGIPTGRVRCRVPHLRIADDHPLRSFDEHSESRTTFVSLWTRKGAFRTGC